MKKIDESNFDDNVVNAEEYERWRKLEQHPILNEEKTYVAECGFEVNLGLLTHILKKRIEHLSEDEQLTILEHKKVFSKIRAQANMAKNKAFGKLTGAAAAKARESGLDTSMNELKGRMDDLLELFGSMHSIKEVHKIAVADWGLPISIDILEKFRKKFNDQIGKKIELFKQSIEHMRLAQQAGRLEELCWLYEKAKEKYKSGNYNRNDGHFAKELLKDIKSEVDGDRLIIDANMNIDIESTVNLHIQKESLDALLIRQMIIGRVAAKTGVQPAELVNRLTQSYYSGYSGAVDADELDYQDIKYPSDESYDFDKINKMAAESKESEDDEAEDNSHQESVRKTKLGGNKTKNSLIEKLRQRQEELESKKLDIQKHQITKKHKL